MMSVGASVSSFPAVSEADTAAGGVEGTMLMVIAPRGRLGRESVARLIMSCFETTTKRSQTS